jgi:hypothetical protein
MLPNLKFLVCGVVFGLLLFAATGAGVMLPDSHTRVGEMPEIGRPMMRRVIAEEPALAQFYTARRCEELERLREPGSLVLASAPTRTKPGLVKPTVVANRSSDGVSAEDVEAPVSQRTGARRIMSKTASGSVPVPHPEIGSDVMRNELDRIAALPPSADGDLNAPPPRLIVVPLPHLRRFARIHNIHRRMFHRKHRVAQAPYNTLGQVLSMQRSLLAPKRPPSYPPPHAEEDRMGDAEQIAPGDAT